MARILVLGNINADRVVRLRAPLRRGDDVAADDCGYRLGGAAANAATALARAGHAVRLAGVLGSHPTGEGVAAELAAWGLDLDLVVRRPGTTAECLILVEPDGERTIIGVSRGPEAPPWPEIDVAGLDAAYIASRWPPPAGLIARLRALGVPVVMQWRRAAAAERPDILVTSAADHGTADIWEATVASGQQCRWLVVTRGAHGAYATDGRDRLEVEAVPAAVVDTTGAGDAFAAALVHGLARGWDLVPYLRLGVRWGALQVAHDGSTAAPAIARWTEPPPT